MARDNRIFMWFFSRWENALPGDGKRWSEHPLRVRIRAEAWWYAGVVLSGPRIWWRVAAFAYNKWRNPLLRV